MINITKIKPRWFFRHTGHERTKSIPKELAIASTKYNLDLKLPIRHEYCNLCHWETWENANEADASGIPDHMKEAHDETKAN